MLNGLTMPNSLSIIEAEVILMTYDHERQLAELVRRDPFFQELLSECENRSQDFHRIKNLLSAEDQELLDLYIAVCEELEYRRGCLSARLPLFA